MMMMIQMMAGQGHDRAEDMTVRHNRVEDRSRGRAGWRHGRRQNRVEGTDRGMK